MHHVNVPGVFASGLPDAPAPPPPRCTSTAATNAYRHRHHHHHHYHQHQFQEVRRQHVGAVVTTRLRTRFLALTSNLSANPLLFVYFPHTHTSYHYPPATASRQQGEGRALPGKPDTRGLEIELRVHLGTVHVRASAIEERRVTETVTEGREGRGGDERYGRRRPAAECRHPGRRCLLSQHVRDSGIMYRLLNSSVVTLPAAPATAAL